MCRLLGYCSRGSASAANLLTEQGLRDFTALSNFHSDGWGMAWLRMAPAWLDSAGQSERACR